MHLGVRATGLSLSFLALGACIALAACGSDPPGTPLVTGSGTTGAGGGDGSGGSLPTNGILSQTMESVYETQPALAVNSKGHVLVAWVSYPAQGPTVIGYTISPNQGGSWTPVSTIQSPAGADVSPPSLAVDTDDEFLITWLASSRSITTTDIYLAKTSPATETFGAAEQVSDPKKHSVYGPPSIGVTKLGTTLIAYTEYIKNEENLAFATRGKGSLAVWLHSPDGMNGMAALPFVCATKQFNNTVYVTFVQALGQVGFIRSMDEGATWTGGPVSDINQGFTGWEPAPCVAEGGEFWVTYGLALEGKVDEKVQKLVSVHVAHSSDSGMTFDPHVEGKDPMIAPYAMDPHLAIQADSSVDIAYYAGSGNGDEAAAVRWANWPSGKKIFSPSQIAHQPIFFTPPVNGPRWMGDRLGFTWYSGSVFVAFVDNSGPDAHVGFYRGTAK